MNIAEQIATFHKPINDYSSFVEECESKAVDIEQDIDNESTLYEFADGSVIVWVNSEIFTYGCRN